MTPIELLTGTVVVLAVLALFSGRRTDADVKERRYALLKAAATIYATEEMKFGPAHSVQLAEELLAEIEKREGVPC